MKTAKMMIAGAAALSFLGSALAQQALTGTITKINRINGTIAIRQTQSGTVGAGTSAAAEEFKVRDATSLKAVHAGDRVTFSVTEGSGTRTITKLEKH
jgi:Cu/Ag efflux protein CusF